MNEFEFIRRLREQTRSRKHSSRLVTGIGDDASVINQLANRDLVVTADLLIEGVDFHRDAAPGLKLIELGARRGKTGFASLPRVSQQVNSSTVNQRSEPGTVATGSLRDSRSSVREGSGTEPGAVATGSPRGSSPTVREGV